MTTATQTTTGQSSNLVDQLYQEEYVLIRAFLKLKNGDFLQPTGFPDIGPCIYRGKDGRYHCLIESEQSMSNRLEAVCLKSPGIWVDDLRGLPLITVTGETTEALLATNLTEPHRIASSYILESILEIPPYKLEIKKIFERMIGLQNGGAIWPLDRRADLENLVFALDPAALLHGFQFVQWKFVGLRQTRLIHARLEATLPADYDVHYGLVKFDAIEPDAMQRNQKHTNKGQTIAAKSRIVPKEITATFEIDVLGLKSLSLDEEKKKFLLGLGLWKIGAFLSDKPSFDPRSRETRPSLRLRADCHLECESISWRSNRLAENNICVDELLRAKPQITASEPQLSAETSSGNQTTQGG